MSFTTLLTCFAALSTTGWAQYVLEDDYMSGGNFFDQFSFWDSADPTNGFVAYQDASSAADQGLISASSTNVRMSVDNSTVTPNGRPSVRITSNKSYDSGLFILDLAHMPGGICGTWPAYWLVGPDWPDNGEIDIIEGVNEQNANDVTLHTSPGCTISSDGATFSGSLTSTDCDTSVNGNQGCQIAASDSNTYGSGFNANNGGVYATEWTDLVINTWFFPSGSVPSDISSGSPSPSSWGKPLAQFTNDNCDIASKFNSQQIVFDTTFCGDWAGAVWSSGSCASKTDTCNAFVENNPEAFEEAYWSINSLKVYQSGSGTWNNMASVSISSTSSVSASIATSSSVVASVSESSTLSPTLAISSKPVAPILSTGVPSLSAGMPPALNATPSYFAGNATNGTYPTGSAYSSGTAPVPSSTAISSSVPVSVWSSSSAVVPTSISAASVPSSPAETTPASSAPATAPTSSQEAPTQSYNWQTHSWGGWHHGRPTARAEAIKRHVRAHKRHAAGHF